MLMMQTQAWKSVTVEMNLDMIRHLILNSLLYSMRNHKAQYGDCIIACDNGSSWRKHAFTAYKGLRGATKDKYKIDWGKYYAFLNEVIEDLKNEFPYTVVSVPHAEGDDVIGVLVRHYQTTKMMEEILIVSGDKDFRQLHDDRTKQYSPILRKFVTVSDAAREIKEHVIKGDRLDGVPNILSADNCLVAGDRQTKMSSKRLEKYMTLEVSEYEPTVQRNWARNDLMINLDRIPDRIQQAVMTEFEDQSKTSQHNNVFNYLFKKGLKELQGAAAEF
jgi:hypothetical protein